MEVDPEKLLMNAMQDGMREAVKSKLTTSYNNPLDAMMTTVITSHNAEFRAVLDDGIKSCMADADFVAELKASVRHIIAKTLVQKFGGELEKQVNALKSDPTTRARITLAIEEIVSSKAG